MDYFLYFLSGTLVVIGLIGAIIPIIPGPPLGYAGLIILHFTEKVQFSSNFLIVWGLIALLVTVLDYFIPLWGTKTFGGSRYGKTGSIIGIVAGLFFAPIGLIVGPFLGAFVGELIHDQSDTNKALKSATGSFIGFLLGTGLKLTVSGFYLYYFIKEVF